MFVFPSNNVGANSNYINKWGGIEYLWHGDTKIDPDLYDREHEISTALYSLLAIDELFLTTKDNDIRDSVRYGMQDGYQALYNIVLSYHPILSGHDVQYFNSRQWLHII